MEEAECEEGDGHPQLPCTGPLMPGALLHLCLLLGNLHTQPPPHTHTHSAFCLGYLLSTDFSTLYPVWKNQHPLPQPFPHHVCMSTREQFTPCLEPGDFHAQDKKGWHLAPG